ncbi:RNA polymerase sigma factor [Christensenellaceae bacterium OttesenSCG-928-K19]|nr:RNA polymerase sigma factor [Christensenellaceae bacterium OttesenSCG-928-K19]
MEYDITTEDGFSAFYEAYYSRVYNHIYYRLLSREDTEDTVSEIFMKIARNAHGFDRAKSSLNTWVWNITKNVLIDFFRKKKALVLVDPQDMEGYGPRVDFDDEYEKIVSPKRKAVYLLLQELPERSRQVVYYKFFEERTNREIAQLLDMNDSTVGTVISRALAKLKSIAPTDLRG